MQEDLPTVGIWLLPNKVPGMLEDFIRFLVPQEDRLWERAERSVQRIPIADRLFSPQHLPKVKLHTWLAWQTEPGTAIGQAITKRYLDAEATQAQQLVRWINRLFNE